MKAVSEFSRLLFGRLTRAEMVRSSLSRKATAEAVERKAAYDKAYVEWNEGGMNAQLLMRRLSAANGYTSIERIFETRLVGLLAESDACVTPSTAEQCTSEHFREIRDDSRHCSFELVSLLDALASTGERPRSPTAEELATLEQACARRGWQQCGGGAGGPPRAQRPISRVGTGEWAHFGPRTIATRSSKTPGSV